MWSKIYIVFLAIAILTAGFFTFYSWSWLQSIGQPAVAAEGSEYHSNLAWDAVWVSTVALLITANAVLWKTGRGWAMWTTFLYFAAVFIVRCFWLEQLFLRFNRENGLSDRTMTTAPLTAVVFIGLMAAIVFFDEFLMRRLRAKMFPADAGTIEKPDKKENSRPDEAES